MQKVFEDTCIKSDAILVEFNGEADYVHLLVNYPPIITIAVFVNVFKGTSSRKLRQCLDLFRQSYWRNSMAL